ncbi:hypothetical protein CYMTET_49221, partial [Cymbomonas tetramitiformis]
MRWCSLTDDVDDDGSYSLRHFASRADIAEEYGGIRHSSQNMAQRLTESQVGITQYMTSAPAFTGTLKLRFTDFIVNEVDLSGKVVRLTTTAASAVASPVDEQPKVEESSEQLIETGLLVITETFGDEVSDKVKTFVLQASDENRTKGSTLVLPVEKDKAKRTRVHQCVRENFKALGSDTVEVEENMAIRLFVDADEASQ